MSMSRKVANLLSYLPMSVYLVILGIVIAAALFGLVLSERRRAVNQKTMAMYPPDDPTAGPYARRELALMALSVAMATVLMLSAICATGLAGTYFTAREHGYVGGLDTDARSLWDVIDETPIEDSLPDNLGGALVLCYRFGCPDCGALYREILGRVQDLDDIYWISTRTKTGQAFTEQYPVDLVPSAVYIRKDGKTLTYVLYVMTTEGPVLDEDAMADMLTAVSYDRAH